MSFHRSIGKKTVLVSCYVDDLKQRLISIWAEFKQSVIDKAIDQWLPRLRACVNNWLIKITVCLLNDFFLQRHFFRAICNFKDKHSHCSILICGKKQLLLRICKVVLFRCIWKLLWHFVANLSKILHISFYRTLSSIVEVIKKILCVFKASQCKHHQQNSLSWQLLTQYSFCHWQTSPAKVYFTTKFTLHIFV